MLVLNFFPELKITSKAKQLDHKLLENKTRKTQTFPCLCNQTLPARFAAKKAAGPERTRSSFYFLSLPLSLILRLNKTFEQDPIICE